MASCLLQSNADCRQISCGSLSDADFLTSPPNPQCFASVDIYCYCWFPQLRCGA